MDDGMIGEAFNGEYDGTYLRACLIDGGIAERASMSNRNDVVAAVGNVSFDQYVKDIVATMTDTIRQLQADLSRIMVGRTVEIVSNWNGQTMGCSRKSRRGRRYVVREVCVVVWGKHGPLLFVEGEFCGLHMNDVKFVDPKEVRL